MTEEEKKKKLNYLLSYTPKVMPANPTAQGWTESQIRQYQYKGYEILFGYLFHSDVRIDMLEGKVEQLGKRSALDVSFTKKENDDDDDETIVIKFGEVKWDGQ